MGVVWRAFDTVLNTDVALKMLLDASDETALRMFYEECHKQSALAHPNIVEIRDVGVFDEGDIHRPYLVMPLLRGATLASIIRTSSQPLATERCIDIISQACRGLHAAHDCGLLHRDIKPSNLFVLKDDSVKIIDFGVAHRLDLSRTVGRKGTLLYMSPEQLSMKPLTRASDVFSLAVVCYEALTHQQPFRASTEDGIIEAIRNISPPPASSINANLSVSVSQVLCKGMAKDPRHRFASIKEFGDYLRRAQYDDSLAVFDAAKFGPRLEKASEAYQQGNLDFSLELIRELESEGYLSTELRALSTDVESAIKTRTIEQLLESARARVQDGEYRLALQRVQEALELDARHEEALVLQHDIEARRAEADIVDWLRVGQQHLEKLSFSHARQAAQRIFEMQPNEQRARDFLSRIERRESELRKIREHKRQTYEAALEAEGRNDLTSALSNMKEVLELERQAPDLKEPGQLATYQRLYNKLHAEHEAVASSYLEAKQALERGDYTNALRMCGDLLDRYPRHALFKALKFDTEQRWRRAISIRLIEIEEVVENEPDLDQRVRMLEDVVRETPEVVEFSRLLQVTREKRDLVNSIANRAREYESRELYGEALVQWDTLQTIYPAFPGLHFEMENLRLRRQLAERAAMKDSRIAAINQAVELGEFEEAFRLLSPAREDCPDDREFAEIEAHIRRQQELVEQAQNQIRHGRKCVEDGQIALGLETLRCTFETAPQVKHAKPELIDALLHAARTSQSDARQARAYLQEILSLDPSSHAATGLLRFLDDQEEYQFVDGVLLQARQLRATNDLRGAIDVLESACSQYPKNTRLRQMLREADEGRVELRARDLEAVRRKRLHADTIDHLPSLDEHVAAVDQIAGRYKDDEEFQHESRRIRERLHTIAETMAPVGEKKVAPELASGRGSRLISRKISPILPAVRKILTNRGVRIAAASAAGAILLVIAGSLLRHNTVVQGHPSGHRIGSPVLVDVLIRSTPAGAHIFKDGREIGIASPTLFVKLPPGKSNLEARIDGYASEAELLDTRSDRRSEVSFKLSPMLQQLRILGEGKLSIDKSPAVPLKLGSFLGSLNIGKHELHWIGKSGFERTFQVEIEAGKPAVLLGASQTQRPGSFLLVSTASEQTHLYTNTAMPIHVDGKRLGVARGSGLAVALPVGIHAFTVGKTPHVLRTRVLTDTGQLLQIIFEDAPDSGSLTILTNLDGLDLKLVRGTTIVREGSSAEGRLDLTDVPAGEYLLQATGPHSDVLAPQPVVIKAAQTSVVKFDTIKAVPKVPLRVQTLPGANVLVDGVPTGTTGGDGYLYLASLAAGVHHIEARRGGKSVAQDVTLKEGNHDLEVLNLKLDRDRGTVSIQLDPAGTEVTVYDSKGEPVSVNGTQLALAEGKYRIVARANGYLDRTETVDVTSAHPMTVNLRLSPITVSDTAPVMDGWEAADWTADSHAHTLTHTGTDIGLYAAQPSDGTYVFSGSIGHGFLITRPKVEWVANYRDSKNYLLFSIDRTGFEQFAVVSGKRIANGARIPLASLLKYQVMFQIAPGRVITSIGDGHGWKQLAEWTNLPQDVDMGRFGFKGPVTLTSFSHIR